MKLGHPVQSSSSLGVNAHPRLARSGEAVSTDGGPAGSRRRRAVSIGGGPAGEEAGERGAHTAV